MWIIRLQKIKYALKVSFNTILHSLLNISWSVQNLHVFSFHLINHVVKIILPGKGVHPFLSSISSNNNRLTLETSTSKVDKCKSSHEIARKSVKHKEWDVHKELDVH